MIREDWKWVVGFEGLYQVSRFGEVRSVDRIVTVKRCGRVEQRKYKGRVLRAIYDSYGYARYSLCKGGRQTTHIGHRVVAVAWLGPCPEGCEVCHGKNGRTDNSVSNLRWDTYSANEFDKIRDGTSNTRCVRRSDGEEYFSIASAAKDTGCRETGIWSVCNGRSMSSGGYGWSYIND